MGTDPSMVPSNKRQWAQSGPQEAPAEYEKNVFTLWVTEHCNKVPREVVESPVLENSKAIWTQSCATWDISVLFQLSCQLLHALLHI